MASRRNRDSYQDLIINKKLKLGLNGELPENTVFFNDSLSEELHMYLNYDDYVMNNLVVGIKKTVGQNTCEITLDELECDGLLKHIPLALTVAKKYSGKNMPDLVDIPFETKLIYTGEIGVIVFVKENSYKRGEIDIDIRSVTCRSKIAKIMPIGYPRWQPS